MLAMIRSTHHTCKHYFGINSGFAPINHLSALQHTPIHSHNSTHGSPVIIRSDLGPRVHARQPHTLANLHHPQLLARTEVQLLQGHPRQ